MVRIVSAMISRDQAQRIADTLGGLLILGCLEGSPFRGVGVRYGDVLTEVNGMRVRTLQDYVDAKDTRAGSMAIVFVRDGQVLRAEAAFTGVTSDPADMVHELAEMRLISEENPWKKSGPLSGQC